jgi:hypothetical protein
LFHIARESEALVQLNSFGLRRFVAALGHELANDGIDVAICAEA